MKYSKKYFDESTTKNKNIYKHYIQFLHEIGVTLKNKRVCDVGCATGIFLGEIIHTSECYGIDISSFAIKECQKKFNKITSHFVCNDLNNEPLKVKKEFDVITMFDVIEHLHNFGNFKNMIKTNLKKDGYIVITTPNANSFMRFISKKNFTGEIDKTHVVLFTPYILDFFLTRLGLKKVALFTPYSFYFKNNFLSQHISMGGQIVAIYRKGKI